MKSWFLWAGIVVLAVIAAAAVFAWSWDWSSLKGYAEQKATAETGKKVTIGAFRVDFSLRPLIHAEEVKVENVSWSSQPLVAHFPVIEARVELFSLLFGDPDIVSLTLKSPEAVLEVNEEGAENWSRQNGGEHTSSHKAFRRLSTVGTLRVTDGKLTYENRSGKRRNTLKIASCTVSVKEPGAPLIAQGEGERNGLPLSFRLQGAPTAELNRSDGRYPLEADVEVSEIKGTIEGTIVPTEGLRQWDFQATSRGPDPQLLGLVLGLPVPHLTPYECRAHVVRQDHQWTVEGITGTVGESDVSGSIRADTSGEKKSIQADFHSDTAHMSDIEVFLGATPEEKGEHPKTLFPDKPFSFSLAPDTHSVIKYRAEKVESKTYPVESIDVSVEIEDQQIRIQRLELGIGGGTVSSELTMDTGKDPPSIRLKSEARDVDLRKLLAKKHFAGDFGVMGGRLELHGAGSSVSRFLGASDGRLSIIMSGGQLNSLLLDLMTLDITKLLLSLSDDSPEKTNIRCAVLDAPVESGVVKIRSFVVDTEDTQLAVEGALNLQTEKPDLTISPHPKNPRFFSIRSSVHVSGTLKDPDYSAGGKQLAIKGLEAFALGVIATPLAALVPFIDRGADKSSSCRQLMDAARKGR